jgi:hypothetical protein
VKFKTNLGEKVHVVGNLHSFGNFDGSLFRVLGTDEWSVFAHKSRFVSNLAWMHECANR